MIGKEIIGGNLGRKLILIFFLLAGTLSFGEVKVKIIEPMRFHSINTTHLDKTKVLGVGVLEVHANNREEDFGKKLVFEFPEYGIMTNRRRYVKVEKFGMEEKEKELIITKEWEHIKFYAVLDRRELNQGEDIRDIEGEYVGYVPIIVSQYSRNYMVEDKKEEINNKEENKGVIEDIEESKEKEEDRGEIENGV